MKAAAMVENLVNAATQNGYREDCQEVVEECRKKVTRRLERAEKNAKALRIELAEAKGRILDLEDALESSQLNLEGGP